MFSVSLKKRNAISEILWRNPESFLIVFCSTTSAILFGMRTRAMSIRLAANVAAFQGSLYCTVVCSRYPGATETWSKIGMGR